MVLKGSFDDGFICFVSTMILFSCAAIIAIVRTCEVSQHNKDFNVTNTKAKTDVLEQIILDDLGEQRKAYTIQKRNANMYNIIPMVFKE